MFYTRCYVALIIMEKIEKIKEILKRNSAECLEARDCDIVDGVEIPIWKARDFDGAECYEEVKRYFKIMQEINDVVNAT